MEIKLITSYARVPKKEIISIRLINQFIFDPKFLRLGRYNIVTKTFSGKETALILVSISLPSKKKL